MKNLYHKSIKKLSLLKKSLVALAYKWLNALKKDFSLHNKNTELLAIWTVLFMIITGLFIVAIKSTILIMFLLFAAAIMIMLAGAFVATYYLHSLKYHAKKQSLPKAHNFLNKSFKLRSLLRFIKIPRISTLNNLAKNLRLAS